METDQEEQLAAAFKQSQIMALNDLRLKNI